MQSTQSQLKLKIWQGSKKNYDRLLTYKELEVGTIYFVGDDATFGTSKTGIIYIAVSKEKAVLFGAFDMAQLSQKVDEIERLLNEANGDIDRLIAEVSGNTEKLATIEEGAEKNKINAIERNGQAITPTVDKVINILIPINTSELNNDSEYQTSADVAETIIGVDLNIASGIITLTRKNGTTFTIDLPTEKIIKSGYYDSEKEEIVMVLADDSEIRFSASKLIDEYYADNVTLEQYTDTADGNKKKFRLTTSYKNKVDGAEQVSNKTASVTSASTATQYPSALAVWNAIKNFATSVQTFTTASTRANIESGETISTIFGKIRKWFADLKAVAFSGSYNDLSDKPSIGNGTITIKQKGVDKGSFSTNQTGNATIELTDENTTYGIATSSAAGLVKSGGDITVDSSGKVSVNKRIRQIIIPGVDSTNSVHYVKIASVNLTTTTSNSAQAIISGTGGVGYIMKDIAVVLISARNDSTTEHIRLLKINKNSSAWSLGCGYVKGTSSIDFYITVSRYNGYRSNLIPLSEDADRATFLNTLTATTTKPSGWVDGSVGSVFSDFNLPTLDITDVEDADITDNTFIVTSRTDGLAINKTIYRRSATYLWNYIKDKISSVLGLTDSNYKGLAKYATSIKGLYATRNNNSRYVEIGRVKVPSSANIDRSFSIYIKGYHNTNFEDSYIFNVRVNTSGSLELKSSIRCVMGSRNNYNEVLTGELTSSELILYLDCKLQNYAGWQYSILVDVGSHFIPTSTKNYVSEVPAYGGVRVSQSNYMLANRDGDGNIINITYRKLNDVLEITDSNLATYYNSDTEVLSGFDITISNIVINTTSFLKKISAIQMTDVFNGKRIALVGNYETSERYALEYPATTNGRFSSYLYRYKSGMYQGTSLGPQSTSSSPKEAYEDFIYFNGVWYSKGY